MHPVLCTNTHHDVTDLVNHGMVKNTKTWMSWIQSIIFLQNKKILNRWHMTQMTHFEKSSFFSRGNLLTTSIISETPTSYLRYLYSYHQVGWHWTAGWHWTVTGTLSMETHLINSAYNSHDTRCLCFRLLTEGFSSPTPKFMKCSHDLWPSFFV